MKLQILLAIAIVGAISVDSMANIYLTAAAVGEQAGRAASLLSQARAAIGGEAAVEETRSIALSGTCRMRTPEGEIAKDVRMIYATERLKGPGDVMILRRQAVPADEVESTELISDGEKRQIKIEVAGPMMVAPIGPGPHFFRYLLAGPDNGPMSAKYLGEETVDGVVCNVLEYAGPMGGSKLYLDVNTNLPYMVRSQGVGHFRMLRTPEPHEGVEETRRFIVRLPAEKAEGEKAAETVVRFGDYRPAGSLILPYRITSSVNGETISDLEVNEYEFNVPVERLRQRMIH